MPLQFRRFISSVAPVIFGLGFDPMWFGVLVILPIEMAPITPPVAFPELALMFTRNVN